MQYEYRVRGSLKNIFDKNDYTFSFDERAWGKDEQDALDKFLNSRYKDLQKTHAAIVRILPTGRTRKYNNSVKPFIPVPKTYTPHEKRLISYFWIRIQQAETLEELEMLQKRFKITQGIKDLTEEHQQLLQERIQNQTEKIKTGDITPYIYELDYQVPLEWSAHKKFVHYVKKAEKNLKLAGYRVTSDGNQFEITISKWTKGHFERKESIKGHPLDVILWWERLKPYYKEINEFVDVLPENVNNSVIAYVGMETNQRIQAHLQQLEKNNIIYWLLEEDGWCYLYVLREDFSTAKRALSNIRPHLLYSIDDMIDDFFIDKDEDEYVDKNGNLTEAFWESYD